jgi:nitrate reductase gamma subunit
MATWVVPVKHMIKGTRLFSAVSFLFHIGIILIPLLLIDHVALWEDFFGVNLISIGRDVGDFLTILTMLCIIILICCRLLVKRQRAMSRRSDYILLVMVFLPFLFGYMAGHPDVNPFPWTTTMFLHVITAEILFVVIPFTKLAHIVLYFFDRLSAIHWQLKPGAGDKIAKALFGKEAKV